MAADDLSNFRGGLDSPARSAAAVVKSDSTVLNPPTRGLYIGVTGDVVVDMLGTGTSITFKAVPAGAVLPLRVSKVKAATTATDIVALF